MKGNNAIILNSATMKTVVQHYFDTVLFATGQAPTVDAVGYDGANRQFEVKVTDSKTTIVEDR